MVFMQMFTLNRIGPRKITIHSLKRTQNINVHYKLHHFQQEYTFEHTSIQTNRIFIVWCYYQHFICLNIFYCLGSLASIILFTTICLTSYLFARPPPPRGVSALVGLGPLVARFICLYIFICLHLICLSLSLYIYTYMYIYREREMYICIYIYI